MTFPYNANTQTFSYSAAGGSAVNFNITHDDYDHVYKTIYGQVATTLTNTANTTDSTATIMEDIAATMLLLKANFEQIKNDIIQIQEDIAALEERGKSDRLGIVTRSAFWGTDCNDAPCAEVPGWEIEVQANSTVVIGANTTFTTLQPDELITINGEPYRVLSIQSDTQLTLKKPVLNYYTGSFTLCPTDSRYRSSLVINVIDNVKECGLYEDLINEINNPTEI